MRALTSLSLAASLLLAGNAPATAQQHRATRLGNPATRFADPLHTPEDLRARFRDPVLRPDIASICQQAGWKGDLNDLYRAAESSPITEIKMPTGTRMPYMSSREGGRPIALVDVLWAGKEPISAYVFNFTSRGRGYRCITPRPCSNFFIVDAGAAALKISCAVPADAMMGRPVEACFTIRNTGDAPEARIVLTLPVPAGAEYVNPGGVPEPATRQLTVELPGLAPGESKTLCATFIMRQPGVMAFKPTARGDTATEAQCDCSTRVGGASAIHVEVVDVKDPVLLGDKVTYEIRILNQGPTTATNLRLVCYPAFGQEFIEGSGVTPVRGQAGAVQTGILAELASRAEARWRVDVRATRPADARFRVEVVTDQFQQPIVREESTRQF